LRVPPIAAMLEDVHLDEAAVRRRQQQNLTAPRPDTRGVAPSIRSFPQAIDRQRQSVEHVPVLLPTRPGLVEIARALDEAEVAALALSLEDAGAELPLFSSVARAVSVPILRCDLLLEEFQVYESRAAGADAVLLHAKLLGGAQLDRLCGAARATHMAACVACETAEDVARAAAARAALIAIARAEEALFAAVPPRILVLAIGPTAAVRGRVDAVLDESIGSAADPAAAFRATLAGE
jgi:indole-3-glycerol phosphate synthase